MFLRKALQSVADQTFQNYEAIIVDDGSTDRCPEIIAKYVRKYSNFKSVRQKKRRFVRRAQYRTAAGPG